jgi:hypothetical protein
MRSPVGKRTAEDSPKSRRLPHRLEFRSELLARTYPASEAKEEKGPPREGSGTCIHDKIESQIRLGWSY